MPNRQRDLQIKRKYQNKQFLFRCLGDEKCVVESLLSQSFAFARTAGWAVQTVETLVQRMRDQMQSKTLLSLHSAISLVLESIAVLRKAASDAGWKEEDSRTQAIFATICSLADKAQPPAASSMAVYQEGLCIIVRVCAAQDWPRSCLNLSCGS